LQLTASQLLLDELVLLEGLQADGVHAMATADVTGVEPTDFQRGGGRVQPAEEVVVSVAQRISPHGVLDTCRSNKISYTTWSSTTKNKEKTYVWHKIWGQEEPALAGR